MKTIHQPVLSTLFLAFVGSCFSASIQNADFPIPAVLPVMPAMARKSGGNWRPELVKQFNLDVTTTTRAPEVVEGLPKPEGKSTCPRNMFYHAPGRQCVLRNCHYGGEELRDPDTGKCHVYLPGSGGYGYSSKYGRGFYGYHRNSVPRSSWINEKRRRSRSKNRG